MTNDTFVNTSEDDSIDIIFQQADEQMRRRLESMQVVEKQRRKHRFLRPVVILFLMIIVLGVTICAITIQSIKTSYPQIKQNFITEYSNFQVQCEKLSNDELTVQQYYEKQLFLLLPRDQLDRRINSMEDLTNVQNFLSSRNPGVMNFLTPEEIARFETMQREYDQYIKEGGDPNQRYIDAVKNNQIQNN